MKKNEKENIVISYHLPTYKEIPAVGLYLDQTSKYINEALEGLPECTITNSMISNYVKKKLIDNPVKKQYGRDQIVYLIFIAVTKSAISLEDADRLFRLQKEKYSTQEAYEFFCERFDKLLNDENVSTGKSEEARLLDNIIMTVVSQIRLHQLLEKTLYK